MRRKIKSKLILAAVFLAGIAVAAAYFLALAPRDGNKTANILPDNLFGWKYPVAKFPATGSAGKLAYSDIRDPGGLPQGLPVRLKIPVIAVDSAIEDALITADGRMDVPAGSVNVAWFSLGPHPGQAGSAVIGGHYGISNGRPFVFYNLDKIKSGDKIYIVDDKGDTLAFAVRAIKSFDRNADATSVFTSSDGLAHLNLITCEGVWNKINDSYPQRLVIFTDLLPAGGAAPASITPVKSPAVPLRTLAPGARGAKKTAVKPALPATAINTAMAASPATPLPPTLVQSAKSLFATPRDGLITLLLLLAIAFTAFKIIRR